MDTPMADPTQPLEILRTIHSFDPCLACSTHVMSPDGQEMAKVQVALREDGGMSYSETKAADSHGEQAIDRKSVYVYEAPVRIWHWVNALAILTLALTGYFIGSPLPSVPGEASANFLMGYIRFNAFRGGADTGDLPDPARLLAIVGNKPARQIFYVPVWSGRF